MFSIYFDWFGNIDLMSFGNTNQLNLYISMICINWTCDFIYNIYIEFSFMFIYKQCV